MKVLSPPNYKATLKEERFDKIEIYSWIGLPVFYIIFFVILYFL